jgi:hypothetical protein
MNKNYQILQKLKKFPFGLWLFGRVICFKAPFFSTIMPQLIRLDLGFGEAKIKKCRRVENHLGTVHAIAIANLCEFIGGTTLEVSLPSTHRWIPKSMNIKYLAKANSDLVAKTNLDLSNWPESGSYNVHVDVLDSARVTVVTADIEMHVSLKKKQLEKPR